MASVASSVAESMTTSTSAVSMSPPTEIVSALLSAGAVRRLLILIDVGVGACLMLCLGIA